MKFGANSAPKLSLGPRPASRKCGRSGRARLRTRPDGGYFSHRPSDFSFGQNPETIGHREATLSGCLHRPESQLLRYICRAGLQRLRDRAAPARVKASDGSHGSDDEHDVAHMVEYGGGEGIDARQRIAHGARKTVTAYLGEHVRRLLRVAP